MVRRGQFIALHRTADLDAYNWLEAHRPEYVTALEEAVRMGATPARIRREFIAYAGEHRPELAKRLELAASHIKRMQDEEAAS